MRKLTFLALIWAIVFDYGTGFAEPQASEVQASLNEDDSFVASFPLLFFYDSGQWVSSSPGKIFTTGAETPDFELPFLKEIPKPILYPRWALAQEWEGSLVVAVEVRENGTVGRWRIMQSSGYALLDEAAVNAIRAWRFEAGKRKGKPIASCIQIPIHFVIGKD